jgi:hypothetical protein
MKQNDSSLIHVQYRNFSGGGLNKITRKVSKEDSRCPDRDLNRAPLEHKPRLLPLCQPARLFNN